MPDVTQPSQKTSLKPVWIALGLSPDRKTLFGMSVSRDRQEAERHASERSPGYDIEVTTTINLMTSREQIHNDLICWFAENGIVGADAIDLKRKFYESIASMMRKERR